MNFAVFASGGGSNFQALIDRISAGDLKAKCAVLITNNSRCGAVQRAERHNIPVVHCSSKTHPSLEAMQNAMMRVLEIYEVNFLVLAGYMKHLPAEVITRFQDKIINIHPSLLPAFGGKGFYGFNVHQAVIRRGVRYTGMTIHKVTMEYDEGPILWQRIIEVLPEETPEELAQRVLALEHDSLWRVLNLIAQGTSEAKLRAELCKHG
jgi:phosphoribosylglycinamide formyltransferase 1